MTALDISKSGHVVWTQCCVTDAIPLSFSQAVLPSVPGTEGRVRVRAVDNVEVDLVA